MKKIIKIIVPLILMLVCVTGAFAQGTLSEEILNQAKREAGLFLELKSALGLDWLDEYNAYLENPTDNPEPSWDLSVADLVSGGYLSDSFPSDFMITKSGQEVTISRIITSQGIKDALPIYLPAVTISGDTVSLLVQRPAQWVAWEDALASKVSRAGDDNPDILPGASLEFGSGSKIEFINNDGKLVGINSLTYKGQELEDRFVNAAGDNMTGPLKINGNIVWHAGNDGSGSGLDADLLEGQHGSFYQNAGNLNAGIVPVARLSGTYNINISGRASVATNADYASNSDMLDGKHASAFALNHSHPYVRLEGKDTITGPLVMTGSLSMSGPAAIITAPEYRINDSNTRIYEGGNNSVRIQTNSGYVDIGPQNTGWVHFNTDRPNFYFNQPVHATNELRVYNTSTYLTGTAGYIDGKKILTEADNVDAGRLLRVIKYTSPGTYTWTKGSGTKYVKVFVWGGGAGAAWNGGGPSGGQSRFGSYVYANGGSGTGGGGFSGIAGTYGAVGEDGIFYGFGGKQPIQYEGSQYGIGGQSTGSGNNGANYGGGAGGFATNVIDVTSVSSVTVVVGRGGNSTSRLSYWRNGGNGAVIVEEYDGKP